MKFYRRHPHGSGINLLIHMDKHKQFFEDNRTSWNQRASVHVNTDFYGVKEFKEGKTSLKFIELEALGDVRGKSLLHLQCHFGQDTLSWEREGAIVTGVDFSDEAIRQAKSLRDELGLKAEFIESNIYDLKENLDKKFDIVFTSYGTIGWLPDLDKWGEIVAHFTKPGGIFYIVEFHPYMWTLDDDMKEIVYPYFTTDEPISEITKGTYADRNAPISNMEHGWDHSLAETIMPLIKNGFIIEEFNEYPFSVYNLLDTKAKEIGPDRFVHEKHGTKIPYMFSIKARKSN